MIRITLSAFAGALALGVLSLVLLPTPATETTLPCTHLYAVIPPGKRPVFYPTMTVALDHATVTRDRIERVCL